MLSKFNVENFVQEHEKYGKEHGFLLFDCPKKPSIAEADIMRIKLDKLSCQKIKKTGVEGCWERSIYAEEPSCTIGEWLERHRQHESMEKFCLEDFWRKCDQEFSVTYPQDCSGGSLFSDADKVFNLNKLPGDLLSNLKSKIPGVNQPMLYAGGPDTFSAFHQEDWYLFSIFYLHMGASKYWLIVAPGDALKLEKILAKTFPEHAEGCDQFFRHKYIVLSPAFLDKHNIRYKVVEQKPGQVIITFPMAWHIVVNGGPNLGEAVNFAASLWLRHTPMADRCKCRPKKGESRTPWYDLRQLVNFKNAEDKEAFFYTLYPNSPSSSFPIISDAASSSSSSTFVPIISSVPSSTSAPSTSSSSSSLVPSTSAPSTSIVPKFYCIPCKRPFKDGDALRTHLKSLKHSKAQYVCPQCLKTCTTNGNLTKHIKNFH